MGRYAEILLLLWLCTFSGQTMESETRNGTVPNRSVGAVKIVVRQMEVGEQVLALDFDVTNDSETEIWVCESTGVDELLEYEVFLDEDGRTLVIRKRMVVPTNRTSYAPVKGRYVRLGPGETRRESISLDLPVRPAVRFADVLPGEGRRELRRLVLEIGFYPEDLPGLVRAILLEAARFQANGETLSGRVLSQYFSGFVVAAEFEGLAGFEASNRESDLSEEVVIAYTYQALKGECCARLTLDGIAIPYDYDGPGY